MLSYNDVYRFESDASPQFHKYKEDAPVTALGRPWGRKFWSYCRSAFPTNRTDLCLLQCIFSQNSLHLRRFLLSKTRKRALCELHLHYKMSTVSAWPRRAAAWWQWEGRLTPTRTMGVFIPTEVTVTTGAPFVTHGNELGGLRRFKWKACTLPYAKPPFSIKRLPGEERNYALSFGVLFDRIFVFY